MGKNQSHGAEGVDLELVWQHFKLQMALEWAECTAAALNRPRPSRATAAGSEQSFSARGAGLLALRLQVSCSWSSTGAVRTRQCGLLLEEVK